MYLQILGKRQFSPSSFVLWTPCYNHSHVYCRRHGPGYLLYKRYWKPVHGILQITPMQLYLYIAHPGNGQLVRRRCTIENKFDLSRRTSWYLKTNTRRIRLLSLMRVYYYSNPQGWMKLLQTPFPLGFNDNIYHEGNISKMPDFDVFSLFEIRKRKSRSHGIRKKSNGKRKKRAVKRSNTSLKDLSKVLEDHGRHCMLSIISSLPISVLRILDTEANKFYDRNHQLYDAALLTRCYTQHALRPFIDSEINHKRHFIKIPFINKGIEFIDLPSIFKDRSVTSSIPAYFHNSEPPIICYKYNKPIRNTVFNFNKLVSDLDIHANTPESWDCKDSKFMYPAAGHIMTGNLKIISDSRIRYIVSKGPKYRFPSRIDFKKCREEIASALNDFGNRWCKREYVEPDALKEWKVSIFKIVDQRFKFFSQNTNLLPPKPKSTFRHLKQGIQDFHRKYVLVPADKAANNVVVCLTVTLY